MIVIKNLGWHGTAPVGSIYYEGTSQRKHLSSLIDDPLHNFLPGSGGRALIIPELFYRILIAQEQDVCLPNQLYVPAMVLPTPT